MNECIEVGQHRTSGSFEQLGVEADVQRRHDFANRLRTAAKPVKNLRGPSVTVINKSTYEIVWIADGGGTRLASTWAIPRATRSPSKSSA